MVDALALIDGVPECFPVPCRGAMHQPVVMEAGTGVENRPFGVDRSRRIELWAIS